MTTATDIPTDATPPMTDLLPRASSGDPGAWAEIMRRYGGVVSAAVRSYRLPGGDELDATQTTWLRLAENAHRVQYPERLGAWLATTARRECLRILHDRAKRAADPLDMDTVADPATSPEQHAIDRDTVHTLRALIAELEPRKRDLLQALFTDNPPSYADIADALGIPIGSIGPTRDRALHQLRRLGYEHGLGIEL